MSIEKEIEDFKQDVMTSGEREIVRKYITSGESFILDRNLYLDLKGIVADHFQIHPNEVLIVGSAKLGFSISENLLKNKKRYRHFGDTSDIDVAIVSAKLFDEIWKLLYDFVESKNFWSKQKEFTSYHFQGWMRPDMLPSTPRFDFTQTKWWDFFNDLTSKQKFGPYKIRGGLYRDWHFLEKYQIKSVEECKDNS